LSAVVGAALLLAGPRLLLAENQASTSDDASLEAIVITGSRLVTNGNAAPTPVTVESAEALQDLAPSSIADALNLLPEFQGSTSPQHTGVGNPATAATDNALNLRQLGAVRALVLFDGLRLPPSASTGLVDATLIPQFLVQRVEVVTGGASAAYGSDAVSGVINFVLDKKFDGVRYDVDTGFAQHGGDDSKRFSIAAGTNLFDGRLHLEGSEDFYNNNGIGALSDRPLGAERWAPVGLSPVGAAGTPKNPYISVPETYSTNDGFYGYFVSGPLANQEFNAAGQLVPFQPGTNLGSGICIDCNGSYHAPSTVTLIAKVQTDQSFGRADLELNDRVNLFGEFLYGHSETSLNGSTPVYRAGAASQLYIFPSNAYLPANIDAQLPANGAGLAIQGIGIDVTTNTTTERSVGATLGANGKFGATGNWDVDYSYDRSQQNIVLGQLNNVNFRAALDAVVNPANGQVVCNVTLTNPGLYPGCTPIDIFGAGTVTAAALAYVQGNGLQESVFEQQVVEANIRSDLFALWAGPVSGAAGAAYRYQSFNQTSNSNPSDVPAATGIRGFEGLAYSAGNYAVGAGNESVKEGYVEFLAPLATEVPLAKSLDLNGAARFTDYSTSGSVTTWKIGMTWQPVEDLRVRATQSRDIRAPTLVELYQGAQAAVGIVTDPHTGVTQDVQQTTEGNAGLKPEKANTTTVGLVFKPAWVRGFTTSIDYYNITIDQAIATPYTIAQILQLCEASNGTGSICNLISRPLPFSNTTPANFPTAIYQEPLNVASVKTHGLDYEADYLTAVGAGSWDTRLLANYVLAYTQQQSPTSAVQHLAGTELDLTGGLPQLKATLVSSYSLRQFSIGFDERLIGHADISRINTWLDNNVPARYYTDLNAAYRLPMSGRSTLEFFLHVDNLFDIQPPIIPSAPPGLGFPTQRGLYDVIGRAFTIGVRGRF
jgi:outer membrane receptor protein involved in Fe transport